MRCWARQPWLSELGLFVGWGSVKDFADSQTQFPRCPALRKSLFVAGRSLPSILGGSFWHGITSTLGPSSSAASFGPGPFGGRLELGKVKVPFEAPLPPLNFPEEPQS